MQKIKAIRLSVREAEQIGFVMVMGVSTSEYKIGFIAGWGRHTKQTSCVTLDPGTTLYFNTRDGQKTTQAVLGYKDGDPVIMAADGNVKKFSGGERFEID